MTKQDILHLRAAVREDADTLGRLHHQSWLETYAGLLDGRLLAARSAEKSAAMFRNGGWRNVLLAFLNGEAAGFCGFGPGRDGEASVALGEIYGLYVLKKAQGRGAGRALLQSALRELEKTGFSTVYLWVLDGNVRAMAFYQRQGFFRDGEKNTALSGFPVRELRFLRR